MLRYAIESERVRIGREESNDIWIDNPAVRPHTLLIYAKDETHCIKVYDGAKVLLNGAPVSGMHRLYSGDRIGIADREFLYGRDDTPAECAVGLTVMVGGLVAHATVFRRTRVRIGRRDADIVLNDAAIGDQHLAIECYGHDGLYACDLGSPTGTVLRGVRIEDRVRLTDGAVLVMGRISLRVHVLPSDGHGLLLAQALPDQPKVPLAAPAPMDRSPPQRHDPSAQGPRRRIADQRPVAGGFVRPLHQNNATAEPPPPEPNRYAPARTHLESAVHDDDDVPVTEIGSLQHILQRAHQQKVSEQQAQRQQRPVVDERPAVRVKAEVMQAGERPPPLPEARARTHEPLRVRSHDKEMVEVSASPTGFHEQMTNVLDTDAIRARTRGGADWRVEAERHFEQRPSGAPLTMALDVSTGEESPTRFRRDDRPRTWVGQAEPAPPPPSAPNLRQADRSRLDKARLSESELAANPGFYRERPDMQEQVDGPVRDRKADVSRRVGLAPNIDRSRRLDPDDK